MILKEFSQYLQDHSIKIPCEQQNKEETLNSKEKEETAIFLLNKWLKEKIETPAASNVDKIIQAEIYIAKNKYNDTLLIAKSESGRKLISTLYNFALSFEQQKLARWIHYKNATDFNNC